MIKRIVDVSERSSIHCKNNQLVISRDHETICEVPIEDLGLLILQNQAITITQAAIIACQRNNIVLVICDDRHLPYSVILPLTDANSLHAKIIQEQINVAKPTKNRIWKQIVKCKIAYQIATLQHLNKQTMPLKRMLNRVRSGDPDNVEAQAAKIYWHLLMGKSFKRDTKSDGMNALLNYGYSITRAMVARAIVGAGLHPALGLHHHNQYNGLCLADDLMEPFRPWVDLLVYELCDVHELNVISRTNKEVLLGLVSRNVRLKDKIMPFMVASHYLVANLKRVFEDSKRELVYPKLVPVNVS